MEELKKDLKSKAYKILENGCVWDINRNTVDEESTVFIFSDIDKLVEELVNFTLEKNSVGLDLQNKTKVDKLIADFNRDLGSFIRSGIGDKIRFFAGSGHREFSAAKICAMRVTIKNGKVTKREFGKKPNSEEYYTAEEIKALLRELEFDNEKFNKDSGRVDKSTFASIIADADVCMDSTIRFMEPDIDNDKVKTSEYYSKIEQICRQAKEKGKKIILMPYPVDKHIVTLMIDVEKFITDGMSDCFRCLEAIEEAIEEEKEKLEKQKKELEIKLEKLREERKECIMCFDSSHCFTKYPGFFKTLFRLDNNECFEEEHFSPEIYKLLEKKPINREILQRGEGTCTFHTEAVVIILDSYIRVVEILQAKDKRVLITDIFKSLNLDPDIESCIKYYIGKNPETDLSLKSIGKFLNDKKVIELIKKKKEEYYRQFEAELKIKDTQIGRIPNLSAIEIVEVIPKKAEKKLKVEIVEVTPQQPGKPLVQIDQLSESMLTCVEKKEKEITQQQPNQKTTTVCYDNK